MSDSYSEIKINPIFNRTFLWVEVLIIAIFYAGTLFLVATGWKKILILLTKKNLSSEFTWVWLKSNIYKYLPGNVFNYVDRQIVANKMGISHQELIQSNIVETILIISTSILISSSILLFMYDFDMNEYFSFFNITYIYVGLVLFAGVLLYFYKYKNIKVTDYWQSMLLYALFFIGIGIIAYYIVNYQMNIKISFLLITAIYTFAWLVGFITPGAPGGIGVRESVFIFLSHGLLGEADAVVLSAMLRIISLIGEVMLFALASKMLKKRVE